MLPIRSYKYILCCASVLHTWYCIHICSSEPQNIDRHEQHRSCSSDLETGLWAMGCPKVEPFSVGRLWDACGMLVGNLAN